MNTELQDKYNINIFGIDDLNTKSRDEDTQTIHDVEDLYKK